MGQSGLIVREALEQYTRLKRIIVTPKALAYQEQMFHDLNALEEKLIKEIKAEDLDIFTRVLNQMIENLS